MLAHPAIAKVIFAPPPLVALAISIHTPGLTLCSSTCHLNMCLPVICLPCSMMSSLAGVHVSQIFSQKWHSWLAMQMQDGKHGTASM